jgi:hypothetical protein
MCLIVMISQKLSIPLSFLTVRHARKSPTVKPHSQGTKKMNRYEYKVVFADLRGRVSVEGDETLIQDGERMTAFARRYLNELGTKGWELVGIQPQPMGAAFHVFKRALAEGQAPEPAKPIEKPEKKPAS